MREIFPLVQIVYWLSLATWFGGVLFVSIVAPIVVRTLRENHPILPDVLSVNLEGQHASLLAGKVMSNIFAALFRVEMVCAAGLFLALLAQWFLLDWRSNFVLNLLRSTMYLAAVVFVFYERRVIWPKVWKHREEYIEHADEPDLANPARELFEEHSRTSVTVLLIVVGLLLGMVLFSGDLHPAQTAIFDLTQHGV